MGVLHTPSAWFDHTTIALQPGPLSTQDLLSSTGPDSSFWAQLLLQIPTSFSVSLKRLSFQPHPSPVFKHFISIFRIIYSKLWHSAENFSCTCRTSHVNPFRWKITTRAKAGNKLYFLNDRIMEVIVTSVWGDVWGVGLPLHIWSHFPKSTIFQVITSFLLRASHLRLLWSGCLTICTLAISLLDEDEVITSLKLYVHAPLILGLRSKFIKHLNTKSQRNLDWQGRPEFLSVLDALYPPDMLGQMY